MVEAVAGDPLSVVGMRLDEARVALAGNESTRGLPLRLVETAPTRKKIDSEINRFGDWRVLRARLLPKVIELTVAREQIID
jgi:hypothetical protein